MKQITLSFFLVIIIAFFSYGQNYHAVSSNIGWCLEKYFETGSCLIPYFNNGDTVINTSTYKKLSRASNITFSVRDDSISQKVWVIFPDSTSETLLYDFSLLTGSQITLNYIGNLPVTYQVDTVDSVSTSLGYRKRIKLSTTDTTFADELIWIEGIGSTYGPIYLYDPTYSTEQLYSSGHCLICCYQSVGIQSYLGNCGIPFGGLGGSSCSSFIFSHIDIKPSDNSVKAYFTAPDFLLVESAKEQIKKISVFSFDGRFIDKYQINNKQFSIQTNRWKNGIYLIKITLNNNQIFTKKIKK